MALILHLTDLHLDPRAGRGFISDLKVTTLEEASLQSRLSTMAASLASLRRALNREHRSLDCIVITGDITHEGRPEGFGLLTGLLANLGDKLPPRDRILVVPGNHDIVRGTGESTPERYKPFLSLRAEGYLTAWLEGIDLDTEGEVLPGAGAPPILIAGDDSYVLVGVNSANHSGSSRPEEKDLVAHLPALRARKDDAVDALLAAWMARGEDDIARVDRAQRAALSTLLATSGLPSKAVRIAAFHHHMYPVGDVEEIKTFESMTNLGEFQDWLAYHQISVALHGHKHVPQVGTVSFTPNGATAEHRMLVVCGPSLEEKESNKQPLGRLIDIDASYPTGRPVAITDVPATSEGTELAWQDMPSRRHDIDSSGLHGDIVGETVTEVHNKLLALADRYAELPVPLVCRVIDGASCARIPPEFPDYTGEEPIKGWFEEMVEWWQRKVPGRAAEFNHGERLYSYGAEDHDQVAAMAEVLKRDPLTSRALATLVYPERDLVKDSFPSFAMVHVLRNGSKLDVIAYFRKQEMPHWWPVNVAELAYIQTTVLQLVGDSTLTAGSITTVTAKPTGGHSLPRVAVPWIDRQAEKHKLTSMVIPLFAAETDLETIQPLWNRVFSDWVPTTSSAAADGDPLPNVGLTSLADEVHRTQDLFPLDPDTRALETNLRALISINASYSTEKELWDKWATGTRLYRDEVLRLIELLVEKRGMSNPASAGHNISGAQRPPKATSAS